MKRVVYNKKEFIITNQEFSSAILLWNQKMDCYCTRLGALLSPYFSFVEDLDENFIDYEVFLYFNPTKKIMEKYYKEHDKYFKLEQTENGTEKLYPAEPSEEVKNQLIYQEDFFKQKLYLT